MKDMYKLVPTSEHEAWFYQPVPLILKLDAEDVQNYQINLGMAGLI